LGALNHLGLSANTNLTGAKYGALNYAEFRAAMHPTWCMAEGVGFEPTSPFGETVFKTAAIDHSAIPPPKY
jgi:hypothetical protein